jgi:hypothetical protein
MDIPPDWILSAAAILAEISRQSPVASENFPGD